MLLDDKPSVLQFISDLNYFSPADLQLLYEQLKLHEQLPMNTAEVIIFYSVVHFVCSILLDEDEEIYFKNCILEEDEDFLVLHSKMLKFGEVTTSLLVTKFLKNNKTFLNAAEKIKAISILY